MLYYHFQKQQNSQQMKLYKNSSRYTKVNQQKKFHLLSLVLREHLAIKEAAKKVGIKYSTAKTIIFFNRNKGKSYQFDFSFPQISSGKKNGMRAQWRRIESDLINDDTQGKKVQQIMIISSVGLRCQLNEKIERKMREELQQNLPQQINPLSQYQLSLNRPDLNIQERNKNQINQNLNGQDEKQIFKSIFIKEAPIKTQVIQKLKDTEYNNGYHDHLSKKKMPKDSKDIKQEEEEEFWEE